MDTASQLTLVIKNLENPHTDYRKIQHEFEEKNHGLPQPVFFNLFIKVMDHIIYKYCTMEGISLIS